MCLFPTVMENLSRHVLTSSRGSGLSRTRMIGMTMHDENTNTSPQPNNYHVVADVQESAYKKFFWVLMAAMVTWTGLGAYALISVTKDVQYISQSLHQLDSSVNARLAAL